MEPPEELFMNVLYQNGSKLFFYLRSVNLSLTLALEFSNHNSPQKINL